MKAKKFIAAVVTVVTLSASFSCNKGGQADFLTVQLSPYTKDLDIIGFSSVQAESYAKLETGLDGFYDVYVGTGMQGKTPLYWMVTENIMGKGASLFQMSEDESSGFYSDTLRQKYNDQTIEIALLLTHDPATDELQYAWLDENNNPSSRPVLLHLDLPLQKGKVFPALSVERLDGGTLDIGDLKDKIIVLNWWHTGCGPCIEEMPGLNQLVEKYKDNPEIVFVAIANNDKEELTKFFQDRKFDYIQTIGNATASELFQDAYPVNVVVSPRGVVSYHTVGGHDKKHLELEREIEKLR